MAVMATRNRTALNGMDEGDTARDAGTAGNRTIDMATLNDGRETKNVTSVVKKATFELSVIQRHFENGKEREEETTSGRV